MAIDPKYQPAPRGKHRLRFTHSQRFPYWEAPIELTGSRFQQQTLKIIVSGRTAWEPVSEEQLALIDFILDRLPELMPFIVAKLIESVPGSEDPAEFRKYFTQAAIWLSGEEEQQKNSWTFVVENLADDGEEAMWGIHLEFIADELQEIWGGS